MCDVLDCHVDEGLVRPVLAPFRTHEHIREVIVDTLRARERNIELRLRLISLTIVEGSS